MIEHWSPNPNKPNCFLVVPKEIEKTTDSFTKGDTHGYQPHLELLDCFHGAWKGAASALKSKHNGRGNKKEANMSNKIYRNIIKHMWNLLDSSRFTYLDSNLNHDSVWFVNGFKHFAKSFQTSSVSNWKLLSFLFDLSFARKRHARFRHTAFIGRNVPSILRGHIFMFPQLRGQLLQKMSTCSIRIKLMIEISGFFSTTSAHE